LTKRNKRKRKVPSKEIRGRSKEANDEFVVTTSVVPLTKGGQGGCLSPPKATEVATTEINQNIFYSAVVHCKINYDKFDFLNHQDTKTQRKEKTIPSCLSALVVSF